MGFDCALLVYRGKRLPDATLLELHKSVASITLLRWSTIAVDDVELQCCAIYDVKKPAKAIAVEASGTSEERTLSSLVQAAWKQAQAEMPATDFADDRYHPLARVLSTKVGAVCWAMLADHSCMGGFARFEGGELVEPQSEEAIFFEGEDYIDEPMQRLANALGVTPMEVDQMFFAAFPDDDTSKDLLQLGDDACQWCAFDPQRHELALA